MEKINIEKLNYTELNILNIEDSFNDTMDIEVENDHYYTLDNGIVSHNTVSIMTQTAVSLEIAGCFSKRK